MPVATISLCVLASSQEACTSAFRPRLSGIHSALYPHCSTRLAKAAAAAALMLSIETQMPSFPSFIGCHSFTTDTERDAGRADLRREPVRARSASDLT